MQFADLHRDILDTMEKMNHVRDDIYIMCSCICQVPVPLIVLFNNINFIIKYLCW